MRRITLGFAVAAVVVVLMAAPAFAHADLKSTVPAAGSVLQSPPAKIDLFFTESVEMSLGGVEVYDANARPVETGKPEHPDGRADAVTVALPPDLEHGTYVVTWRLVSGDSHPIQGTLTFVVGTGATTATAPQALARGLIDDVSGNATVGTVFGAVRFASYASLIVLLGGFAFLLALWPGGSAVLAVRRLFIGALAVAIVVTVAGIALQGVYGAGLPLINVFRWSVIWSVLDTRFGHAWLGRLGLLVLAAPLVVGVLRRPRPAKPGVTAALAGIGMCIAVTGGIAGHPGTDHPAAFTVGLDAVHFAAVSFWIGGLALLCLVVLRRDEANAAAEVVSRYSPLAFAAVVVIVVTGVIQGWWQVRSLGAVTGTTYGRLLLTKVTLFTGILGLAALSRAWVRGRATLRVPALAMGPGAMTATPDFGRLRRSVAGEAAIAVVVLGVTAVLVNTIPGRTAIMSRDSVTTPDAVTGPFSTQLHTAQVRIDVRLDHARIGPTELNIYTLTHGGAVHEVEELRAPVALPTSNIGPLEVPVQRIGPGHFAAYVFSLPSGGQWLLEVTARANGIPAVATTSLPIQ